MRIEGEWHLCDDGITRPTVQAKVQAADGSFHVEFFLVDSGADRTVFSASVLVRLGFSGNTDPTATDLSILGRDVLNNFDMILSHRCNEVLLLAPNHQYRVERT
jgi:hypothetical protein